MDKSKLTRGQSLLLKEIEEIKENFFVYPHILSQEKESRTIYLKLDKEILIRSEIIFNHLLVNEYFNLEISDYFIGREKKIDTTKRNLLMYDNILYALTFNEKFDIFKKITRANQRILGTIKALNRIRNQLVHYFSPEYEKRVKKKITYKGESIFIMISFQTLMADCYYVKQYFKRRMARK
jgi:hypothetical protein